MFGFTGTVFVLNLMSTIFPFPSTSSTASLNSLGPYETNGTTINTGQLEPGGYNLKSTALHVFNELTLPNGGKAWSYSASGENTMPFVVYSEDSRNNMLIAAGTIMGSVATVGTLLYQVRTSRQNIRELRIENKLIEQRISSERQKHWNDVYLQHSGLLAEILKHKWDYSSGIFAVHQLEDTRFVDHPSTEPDTQNAIDARSHLIKGYPDLWNLYELAKAESEEIRKKRLAISDKGRQIVSQAIQTVIPSLPKVTETSSDLQRYYNVETMTAAIFIVIQSSKVRKRAPELCDTSKLDIHIGHLLTEVYLRRANIARGEDDEMLAVKETVDKLVTNPDLVELVCEYYGYGEQLLDNKNIQLYRKGIDQILDDLRSGVPIKARKSCRICTELYDTIFESPRYE